MLSLLLVFALLLIGFGGWLLSGGEFTSKPSAIIEPAPQNRTIEAPRSILSPEPPVPLPETIKPPNTPAVQPPQINTPEYRHEELVTYALALINRDRMANGLAPVALGSNIAAQRHAEERLANRYISHWGMDGMKPYMRYTLAGGENSEAENAFSRDTYWTGRKDSSYRIDPKEVLEEAQAGLMTSPGHRKTILDKWHKRVNLGIAYDDLRLDLVQQFEGDYIDFSDYPNIEVGILSMSGKSTLGTIENIAVYYDPLPEPLTSEQLDAPPYDYSYGWGESIGNVLPPLPPDYYYTTLLPTDVIATIWDITADGSFNIEVDIRKMLSRGKGIYTVVVWVETEGEFIAISNYSLFIK